MHLQLRFQPNSHHFSIGHKKNYYHFSFPFWNYVNLATAFLFQLDLCQRHYLFDFAPSYVHLFLLKTCLFDNFHHFTNLLFANNANEHIFIGMRIHTLHFNFRYTVPKPL